MVSISIDIDDQVKEHFNKFIEKHGTNIDVEDVKEAIKSDRTTLIAAFERQCHRNMADIIRSL